MVLLCIRHKKQHNRAMNKQQLANRIWASANSMRNKIDANEYKDYILGLIFYKFLSDTEIKFLASLDIEEDDLPNVVEDENNPDMATLIEECQKRIGFLSSTSTFSTHGLRLKNLT